MLQTNVDLDSKVSEVSKRVFLGTLFVAQSTTQSSRATLGLTQRIACPRSSIPITSGTAANATAKKIKDGAGWLGAMRIDLSKDE